ncbi:hypothetical protein JNW90_25730 [Micromonospora sp. STR1s_5]|nr:hypothetical protein [Micromonospora sp. STR1s_5]
MWPAPMPPAGSPTARSLLRALGWTPGLALHVDVVHAAVLMTPTPVGAHVVGTREELPLPASAERRIAAYRRTGAARPALRRRAATKSRRTVTSAAATSAQCTHPRPVGL